MKIIHKILQSGHFNDRPPVLVDIGASGEINAKWKMIAPYCICLAYDADDREFHVTEQTNSAYRKLITFNRIVTAEPVGDTDFYLTASPFCSSLLEPDKDKLSPWIFSDLFTVEKKTRLPAITLSESLSQAKIAYIDWFKTDTQGTDLRLFTSLSPSVQSGIMIAEFEPGILDAYKGEDKLFAVMQQMHAKGFWLSSMEVRGVQRLNARYIAGVKPYIARRIMRRTPGWAEVTYLRQPQARSTRDFLLLIVFALLERQYGFALETVETAIPDFPDVSLFRDVRDEILRELQAERRKAPLVYLKQKINQLFFHIHD
jgi:hypothetical protein